MVDGAKCAICQLSRLIADARRPQPAERSAVASLLARPEGQRAPGSGAAYTAGSDTGARQTARSGPPPTCHPRHSAAARDHLVAIHLLRDPRYARRRESTRTTAHMVRYLPGRETGSSIGSCLPISTPLPTGAGFALTPARAGAVPAEPMRSLGPQMRMDSDLVAADFQG